MTGYVEDYTGYWGEEAPQDEGGWWDKMNSVYDFGKFLLEIPYLAGWVYSYIHIPVRASEYYSISIAMKKIGLSRYGTKDAEDALYSIARRVYPLLRGEDTAVLDLDTFLARTVELGNVVKSGSDIEGIYRPPSWLEGQMGLNTVEVNKIYFIEHSLPDMNPKMLGLPTKTGNGGLSLKSLLIPGLIGVALFVSSKKGG